MRIVSTLLVLMLFGCSSQSNQNPKPTPTPTPAHKKLPQAGVDPTFTWTAATLDCTGATITGATYNVYYVTGPGPMPFVTSNSDPPCGPVNMVDTTLATKLNSTPVTGTTFSSTLGVGTYTAAIESVASDGTRGSYREITFQVIVRPKATTTLSVH